MSAVLPAWVDRYRGRPFLRNADGPEAFDCYGLVRAVLRDVWGLATPALDDAWHLDTAGRLARALGDGSPWREVDGPPAPGDVLAFDGPELHVAIVVAPGWMLQAQEAGGVSTARFDRGRWAALRAGSAYRHRDMPGGAA